VQFCNGEEVVALAHNSRSLSIKRAYFFWLLFAANRLWRLYPRAFPRGCMRVAYYRARGRKIHPPPKEMSYPGGSSSSLSVSFHNFPISKGWIEKEQDIKSGAHYTWLSFFFFIHHRSLSREERNKFLDEQIIFEGAVCVIFKREKPTCKLPAQEDYPPPG
jgi:hypothetical protein